jgi:hypothetical protein
MGCPSPPVGDRPKLWGPQTGKAGSVDGAFGRDPLAREVEHFGELVEVMVVVQDPKPRCAAAAASNTSGTRTRWEPAEPSAARSCMARSAAFVTEPLIGAWRISARAATTSSTCLRSGASYSSSSVMTGHAMISAASAAAFHFSATSGCDARAQADVSATQGPSRQLSATRDLARSADCRGRARRSHQQR